MAEVIDRKSVYDRIGGEAAVDVCVDKFYEKVLADPLTAKFFEKIDMKKQATHQKKFLTFAFGGPNNYTGRALRASHTTLNIHDEHFDAIATHLSDTLKELGVEQELIDEVLTIVETTRKDITNK